jgi:hypothetical protein
VSHASFDNVTAGDTVKACQAVVQPHNTGIIRADHQRGMILFFSAFVSLDLLSCPMSLPLAPQTGEVTYVSSKL